MPSKKPPSKRKDRSKYDWAVIRSKYQTSGLSLAEFCRREKLPYSTARRNIPKDERQQIRADVERRANELKDRLWKELAAEEAKKYVATLRVSSSMIEDIMLEAHAAFGRSVDGVHRNPDALARVAITASQELRNINRELQGIPSDDEDWSWPLTKGFWPHDYQRDFVFDLPSVTGAEIFAFIGGIRSGKTRCGAEKFLDLAWRNKGRQLAVFAPTYRMLQDVTKPMLFNVLADKDVSYQYNRTDNSIVLFGDTKILFRSMDDPDKIRGIEICVAWCDEIAQLKDEEAFNIIQGRLSDAHAEEVCMIITTTPNGFNWLYEKLVLDASKNRAKVYHARTEDNIALPDRFVDQVKRVFDAKLAQQELGGEWVDVFKGKAYWSFQRKVHILPKKKVPYRPDLPLLLMCDFNVSPMAWEVGQSIPYNGDEITYIIDELHIDTADTTQTALEFVRRWKHHKSGVYVYGDAAGRHRHTSATRTDYEIIRETFKTHHIHGVTIKVGRSNPLHEERVKDVNARLRDAFGNVYLYISEECEALARDFDRSGFIPGTRQLDKSDPLVGHASDAVGYYINTEHAIRRIRVRGGRSNGSSHSQTGGHVRQ